MQASVYRAYHVLRARGIPSDHIIVMHYDNMAYNPRNPTPGVVINDVNGMDVYHNVPKDYTGDDVDPQIFISMLKGDSKLVKRGKKVLKSGPNDHVFIYYFGHGDESGFIQLIDKKLYRDELM
ncbi:unnamed protein product, partial [Oppiella nova]